VNRRLHNRSYENFIMILVISKDAVTSTGSELTVLIQLRLFEVQTCLQWVVS
jgi:hypothetical protein